MFRQHNANWEKKPPTDSTWITVKGNPTDIQIKEGCGTPSIKNSFTFSGTIKTTRRITQTPTTATNTSTTTSTTSTFTTITSTSTTTTTNTSKITVTQITETTETNKTTKRSDEQNNSLDEHFSGTLKLVILASIAALLLVLVIIVGIYSCSVGCKKKKEEVRVEENPVYGMSNYEDNIYIKDSNTYYKP